MTSAREGVRGQLHAPLLTPPERPNTHCTRDWMDSHTFQKKTENLDLKLRYFFRQSHSRIAISLPLLLHFAKHALTVSVCGCTLIVSSDCCLSLAVKVNCRLPSKTRWWQPEDTRCNEGQLLLRNKDAYYDTHKWKATDTSKMLVPIFSAIRFHVPESKNLKPQTP